MSDAINGGYRALTELASGYLFASMITLLIGQQSGSLSSIYIAGLLPLIFLVKKMNHWRSNYLWGFIGGVLLFSPYFADSITARIMAFVPLLICFRRLIRRA